MYSQLCFFLCVILSMSSCKLFSATVDETKGIQWLTNYEEAVKQSKTGSKPLVLFFTGSDWCGWCTKLDEEVLGTKEFAETAGSKFIFVKLDFPLYTSQDPKVKTQNKQLQDKFQVRSFPTIVILDPQQNQQIGTTGYRPGGGKAFGEYLIKLVSDYSGYKQKMSAIDSTKISGEELKRLYTKSIELRLKNDIEKIIQKGIVSSESLFFMTEEYRTLANNGKIHNQKAISLREKLLAADPNNEKLTQYQVALIDFQAYSNEMNQNHRDPEYAIAPLLAYINKYGNKDKENPWHLKFLISQIYLDKNEMASALKYAQESYESAPPSVRSEIGLAIHKIRSQIHSSI